MRPFYQRECSRILTITLLLGIFLIPSQILSATIQTVRYGSSQNFKGLFIQPDGPKRFPIILYNYDQTFDWLGEKGAKNSGYDLRELMQIFCDHGYAVFVPIERFRKISAIKDSIDFLERQNQIDLQDLHMVGLSEGAFLSLLVQGDLKVPVRSVTAISPIPFNDTGHFSLSELKNHVSDIQCPVLVLYGKLERKKTLRQVKAILKVLQDSPAEITFQEFPTNKEGFWKGDSEFMTVIYDFMAEH